MSGDFGTAVDSGGGLGNLADELADAWEEEEGGYGYASGQETAPMEDSQSLEQMRSRTPSQGYLSERDTLQPPRPKMRNGSHRHRRHESQYDGSDYGNDSDLEEVADMSPALENQMAEIESLARRGLENNGSEHDHVIERAITALQDLGAQSGIENNAMRYALLHGPKYLLMYQTHYCALLDNVLSHSPDPYRPKPHASSVIRSIPHPFRRNN